MQRSSTSPSAPTVQSDSSANVAGVDEVGIGPLAGPVVACAVILDPADCIDGLDDSKSMSEKRRVALVREIQARAVCVSI